jgi:hypothetical protein
MSKLILYIEDYSDRSIAVFGDTKPYKEQLKTLGLYNPALKNKKENKICPGWTFYKTKEAEVRQLVNDINAGKKPISTEQKISSAELITLSQRIDRLEAQVKILMSEKGKEEAKYPEFDSNETEEDDIPVAGPSVLQLKRR